MTKFIYFIIVISGCSLLAQNKETLYDFTDLPQSLMLNPGAKVDFKVHFGVPLLSQIHINSGFTGASLHDVFVDDDRSINEKIESTLNSLKSTDYFSITEQIEILNVGWRKTGSENIYYSAGIYQEMDLIVYFPKDFAVLAYRGNEDYLNIPFRLSNINAAGELLTVYHMGYNEKVNKKLIFGARAKIYSSIINFRTTRNKGTFTTIETPEGNNFYQHVFSNIDISLETSGYASIRDIESIDTPDGVKQVFKKVVGKSLLGGNLGFGFDLGFTYQLEDQWAITGSANDLGMIFYTKDVESYTAKGDYYFEGFRGPVNELGGQDLLGELEEAIPIDTANTSYSSLRPMKINGSIRYDFNKYDSGRCRYCHDDEDSPYLDALGLQLFSQFRPKRPVYAASFFYYKRLGFLRAKFTYTVDDFSYTNFGVLLSTHIHKFNFYISANNILGYSNLAKSQSAALQIGFNIIM